MKSQRSNHDRSLKPAGEPIVDALDSQQLLKATLDSSFNFIQVFRAVRDQSDQIIDFTWVLTNRRWQDAYGDVIGKSLLQQNPAVVHTGIFQRLIDVTETGVSQTHEHYYPYEQFNGWFQQTLTKLQDGVVLTTEDITERKQAEIRQTFLLKLSDALRPLADPADIQSTASRLLVEHLEANRAVYLEIEGKSDATAAVVRGQYARDVPLFPARIHYADFAQGLPEAVLRSRETLVITDTANDARLTANVRAAWLSANVAASIAVSLSRQGQMVANFALHNASPRPWTPEEIGLVEDVADRTWAAVERTKAEDRLRESEAKYRTVFESVDEGFHISELLYDEAGQPIDWRYLEVNPVFERLTGLLNVAGQLGSVTAPNTEPHWLQVYDQVLKTGKPYRFENYHAFTDRWYTAYACRVGGAGSHRFAVIFDDITERKRREVNEKLLIDISEELSRLSDEEQIVHAIGTKLVAHLTLSCYHYVDVDNEQATVTIRHFWHAQNVPHILGTYPIDDFVPLSELKSRRAGETDVVNDVQNELPNDTASTRALKAGAATQQIGAYVVVPYSQDGAWKAYFAVADSHPRRWTSADVALIEEVAGRLFPRIERVRAEAALRESEEKFRTLFHSIDEGVSTLEAIFDEEGKAVDYRYLENNPAVKKIFGFEWPVGKTVREFLPNVEQHWIETICGVARTGEPVRTEYPVESLGRWISAHFSRVGGEGSRKVVAVYEDITERKEREQQQAFLLQFSDALRAEQSVDDMAIRALGLLAEALRLDRCYIATYHLADDRANFLYQVGNHRVPPLPDAGIRLSDFPQALRVTFEGTLVIEDFAQTEGLSDTDRQNMAVLGLRALVAATLRKGEHNPHWAIVAVSAAPRRWTPNEIALVEEATERTWAAMERARAEEALQESEKRLRLALEATELGLWDWHLLTNEVYWNDQHFRLFGLEPPGRDRQPLPIGPDLFLNHVHPHDRERVAALLQQTIADRSVYDAEFCGLLEDGSQRWMRGYGRIVEEADGNPVRMSGVMYDVDERKRAEEALRLADRRKDEFLAMLAHELRNPLSTIRSGLQILTILAGNDQAGGPPGSSDTIAMMNRQTDHLVRMVDDLLDMSRISQGKIELRKQRVDLVALVRQAVQTVSELYQEQGRHLHVVLPDSPIYLDGDATRLTQVVINLLTNGVRYTGEGGAVWLRLIHRSQQATIEVRDNGIGLTDDQLSAIFELFVQVDNSVARARGGLGLGLTLVRRLVELHGGRTEAASEGLGRGSTFTVYLPTLNAAPTPNPHPDGPPARSASSPRVLVVDDNPDAALTLSMLLKLKGYDVHTRNSGRQGIQAAEELRPNVILCDIGMPDLDGYDTCRAIRQQPWGQAMILIALTGYGQDEDKQRTREAGFDGHLVKPVDVTTLTQLLTEMLNKGRPNAESN